MENILYNKICLLQIYNQNYFDSYVFLNFDNVSVYLSNNYECFNVKNMNIFLIENLIIPSTGFDSNPKITMFG